jgi:hypothetical protein
MLSSTLKAVFAVSETDQFAEQLKTLDRMERPEAR